MAIRIHHFFALLCCAGLTSAMAGCAPEETGATTEEGTESVAVPADGDKEPGRQPETDDIGRCCWWTCQGTGHLHHSVNPTYGQCVGYANNWCLNNGEGYSTKEYWEYCNG